MTVILSLLAVFVILVSIPLLLLNEKKLHLLIVKYSKDLKDAEEDLKKAKLSGNQAEIKRARDAYDEKTTQGCAGAIVGCLSAIAGFAGSIILVLSQLVLIISALAMHVGIPLVGMVVLAIWILNMIYGFFVYPKISARKKEEAKLIGNEYIPETPLLRKLMSYTPTIYAFYILVMIIL